MLSNRLLDRVVELGAVAAVAVAVMAGLWALYAPAPDDNDWRLSYHNSLARFADVARLARCAWLVTGDVTPSRDAAFAALDAQDARARTMRCEWHADAHDLVDRDISWERLEPARLKICGDIRRGYERRVLRDPPRPYHFTFAEIGETKVEEGPHCYVIDIAAAPPDSYGGPP